jgi:hypothetical protein
VATRLSMPISYFDPPNATEFVKEVTELAEEVDDSQFGPWLHIMLRELDADGLSGLLQKANKIFWHLNVKLADKEVIVLLKKFEQAVHQLHQHLSPSPEWQESRRLSLRAQLDGRKKEKVVATHMERLAQHRIAVLGADYLHWDVLETTELENPSQRVSVYTSERIVELSVEQYGVRSRRVQVDTGPEPDTSFFPTEPPTKVIVNGMPLEAFRARTRLSALHEVLPESEGYDECD